MPVRQIPLYATADPDTPVATTVQPDTPTQPIGVLGLDQYEFFLVVSVAIMFVGVGCVVGLVLLLERVLQRMSRRKPRRIEFDPE